MKIKIGNHIVNIPDMIIEKAIEEAGQRGEIVIEEVEQRGEILHLPCKVGDTVYKVCTVNSRTKMGQMLDGRIVRTNCDRCAYRYCQCYDIGLQKHEAETFIDVITPKKVKDLIHLVTIMPYFGKNYFLTEEQAEEAIKKHRESEVKR